MDEVNQHNITGVSPLGHPNTSCLSEQVAVPSTGSASHKPPPNNKNDVLSRQSTIPSTVSVPIKRAKPKSKHKKPEGMPRRPLSAYNFFYKAERIRWLEEQKEKKAQHTVSASSNGTNEPSKQSDFLEMGKVRLSRECVRELAIEQFSQGIYYVVVSLLLFVLIKHFILCRRSVSAGGC